MKYDVGTKGYNERGRVLNVEEIIYQIMLICFRFASSPVDTSYF